MAEDKIKTGVVGCGAISEIYLQNMIGRFYNLEVVACCAKHMENAQKRARQFHIRACTYEEILADQTIRLIVVLTPAPTHYSLIRQALEAGKHVYTEKTMAVNLTEARELLTLAQEKNLYLGAAPDTFLGSALQTAKKAIEAGEIGEVTSFLISANRNLDYMAGKYAFLRMPGGGICYDYGVYYLTALTALLGPVKRVSAIVRNRKRVRGHVMQGKGKYGTSFLYPNESQVTALLELENGIAGNFSLNGDSITKDLAVFYIYGTKGVLQLPNPDYFGGDVRIIPDTFHAEKEGAPVSVDYGFPYSENSRGLGVSQMASAILGEGENQTDSAKAYHVLDIIETLIKSNKSGCFENVKSSLRIEKNQPKE